MVLLGPRWVASQGNKRRATWENAALFDFNWSALPAWEVFNALTEKRAIHGRMMLVVNSPTQAVAQ